MALLGCTAVALALACTAAYAQSTSGGSTYSIFNIGDLQTATSITAAGRGGTETGTPSPGMLNSTNPASWSDMQLTTLSIGGGLDQYQVSDASTTVLQNNLRIREIALGIPVSVKSGITLGIGVHPYSVVNYRSRLERDVQAIDTVRRASISYSGQGGVSRLLVGGSFRPVPELSLGLAYSGFFGTVRSENSVTFDGGEMTAASYRTETTNGGGGFVAGATWEPVTNLRVGAAWESGSTLDRDHITTTLYQQGTSSRYIDTIGTTNDQIEIPMRMNFGASYVVGRSLGAIDVTMQDWSTTGLNTARSMMRVGLGYEYLPARTAASGLELWSFRTGLFMENTYYTMPGGDINAIGGTLGFRIPIADGTGLNTPSALDVALELGTRGTTDNGLTRELFGRLSLEFSLSELWFTTRRK